MSAAETAARFGKPPVTAQTVVARIASIVVAIIIVASAWHIEMEWARLKDLPYQTVVYFKLMFLPPDPSVALEALGAMVDSIQMAWIGTVIAAVISWPLAFLAANNLTPLPIRLAIRFVFNVIRALPELILAVLLVTVTGLTPWTGALAIGIHSIGTLGKLAAEAIEEAPQGPMEAALAVGATWSQRVRTAVWPSIAPEVMSVWLYRFEVNVRASAVLGLIGAGGIGALINTYIGFRRFDIIGTILIVLIIGTVLVDLAWGTVRKALLTGRWPWTRVTVRG